MVTLVTDVSCTVTKVARVSILMITLVTDVSCTITKVTRVSILMVTMVTYVTKAVLLPKLSEFLSLWLPWLLMSLRLYCYQNYQSFYPYGYLGYLCH